MKKVYNNIPIQSLWYCMPGDQKIKIRDFELGEALCYTGRYTEDVELKYCKVVFNGIAKALDTFKLDRELRSQIRYIKSVDNVIVIDICTKADEY